MPSGVFLAGEILYLFVTSLGLIIVMLAVSHFGYHLSLRADAYLAIFCYTVLGRVRLLARWVSRSPG